MDEARVWIRWAERRLVSLGECRRRKNIKLHVHVVMAETQNTTNTQNQNTKIVRLPIRNTKMGAYTRHIVLVQDPQWRILKPAAVVLSKTGHHGEEIYHINVDNYIIITLDISNSGKRSYTITGTGDESAKIKIIPLLEQWKNGVKVKISEIISALQ